MSISWLRYFSKKIYMLHCSSLRGRISKIQDVVKIQGEKSMDEILESLRLEKMIAISRDRLLKESAPKHSIGGKTKDFIRM